MNFVGVEGAEQGTHILAVRGLSHEEAFHHLSACIEQSPLPGWDEIRQKNIGRQSRLQCMNIKANSLLDRACLVLVIDIALSEHHFLLLEHEPAHQV